MKINKQELIKALEVVKPGLANNEMIEQATSFAFMGGRVVTYNDEISISHPVKDLDLEGAVKADKLYKFLSKLKTDEIEGEVTDSEIKLTTKKSKVGLGLQVEIKMPLEEIGKIGKWKDLPEDFNTAIGFCIFSCSRDMSKPVLTCIHVKTDQAESSDNFRGTIKKFKGELPFSFLLPASTARELIRYPIKQIGRGKGWVHFRTASDTIFSCRIFEDNFPEMSHLFDIKGKEIKLPKGLDETLDEAGVFSAKDHFLDDVVKVTMEDKKMLIHASDGNDWFDSEARVRYDGPAVSFTIHTNFLKEICKVSSHCVFSENMMKFWGEDWEHVLSLSVD